ncbi:MAG: RNA-binding S4 domain-containing protein [Vicinamibacterales bacterium]
MTTRRTNAPEANSSSLIETLRLDVWLDVACLFRTRSEAQKACKGGKVDVNGERARPHRLVRAGDTIVIGRPSHRKQHVIVRGLAERHVPKAEARKLYEDVTPPPSPEERELLELERLARPYRRPSAGTPDRRERRELRRMKEGQ